MIYAQFFQKSAISDKITEACGDRSVVIIDGRLSANHVAQIARQECKKRGYLAWQIFKGESFTRSRAISSMFKVQPC